MFLSTTRRKLQLLVLLWFAGHAGAGDPDCHRHLPDHELQAGRHPERSGVPVAFASVEYIMRDVAGGWIIRYMHSTGASDVLRRGLPAHVPWPDLRLVQATARTGVDFGCLIFLCLMAEAFMGYLLPWGQMSFWGAQVIVNLFASDPGHRPGSVGVHPW